MTAKKTTLEHGTVKGYSTHACRCDDCKAAKKAHAAKYYLENRERYRAYGVANAEAIRLRMARWYEENRDWRKASDAAYRKKHRETYIVRLMLRRARRMGRESVEVCLVSEREWLRLCARYGNCCAYCGATVALTRDHIFPIARGGRHSIGNLLPACQSCNASKKNDLLVEWRAKKRRASQ